MKTYYYIPVLFLIFITVEVCFGYQTTFAPQLIITEEYTDNIDLTNNDQEDDYITTISTSFTISFFEREKGAEISYSPTYSFYQEHDDNNTLRHNADLLLWNQLSRNTRLEITNNFNYTEEAITEDQFTIRSSREPHYTNTAGINLTSQFGPEDSISFDYSYGILENEDEDIEDNENHNGAIDLVFWPIENSMGVETGFTYTKGLYDISDNVDYWTGRLRLLKRFSRHFDGFIQYTHLVMEYDGDTENYKLYEPSAGFNYTLTDNTFLSISGGYLTQDWEEQDDEERFNINGELNQTWLFQHGSINLSGSSGYDEELFGAENLGLDIYYQASGTATANPGRYYSIDIFGGFRKDEYLNTDDDREDETGWAGAGITAQPARWLNFRLEYNYRKVDSTINENEYIENRVFFRITLAPSSPIRL